VVTQRHTPPGSPDPEDDPTGMRALLSSLPDPGPMPEHLVSRITASLAAEQAGRYAAGSPHEGEVHELRRTPRRPVWRTAGLAAAAAAVIGIGAGSLLNGTAPGTIGALFGGSGNDSSAAGSAPASGDTSGGASGAGRDSGGAKAESGSSVVTIHHSAHAYTSADFAQQAGAFLAAPGDALMPLSAESPAIGPIGTETGMLECLSALATEPWQSATTDLATFDGTPAVVVVLTTAAGHTAYAAQRSCSTGHPARLAGPVTLP